MFIYSGEYSGDSNCLLVSIVIVEKKNPRITPIIRDCDSDFVDSPPKTSNFCRASTSRYSIYSKDSFKGKQCE